MREGLKGVAAIANMKCGLGVFFVVFLCVAFLFLFFVNSFFFFILHCDMDNVNVNKIGLPHHF